CDQLTAMRGEALCPGYDSLRPADHRRLLHEGPATPSAKAFVPRREQVSVRQADGRRFACTRSDLARSGREHLSTDQSRTGSAAPTTTTLEQMASAISTAARSWTWRICWSSRSTSGRGKVCLNVTVFRMVGLTPAVLLCPRPFREDARSDQRRLARRRPT